MSIKESVNKVTNLVYQLGKEAVIEPIMEFCKTLKLTFAINKLKAVIILLTVFFILSISCFLSYKVFIERNLGSNSTSQTQLINLNNSNANGIGGVINGKDSQPDDGKERALDMYLQSYNGFFNYIGDFFEDYISSTVDPLGHSTTDSSGISFEPVINKNSKIKFASGSDVFYSAYRYASILIGIMAPILVLMVVITGLQVLMSKDNHYTFEKLTQKLSRICITAALIFVGMPLLLTSSIMTTNLLNKLILSSGGATCPVEVGQPVSTKKDLKCFIDTISKRIRNREIISEVKVDGNIPKTVEIDGWDVGSMLKVQGQNFWGFLQIAPIIILTLFMLILLFIVFIQFVIRYLQIYFLFAIYPIVAVMWYNQSTSKYFSEYWKQLVTLLIQQPVFLLCFVIFGDISLVLMQNLSPSNMLIFSIYLVFLVTVPQALTARIFGDVFAYQVGQDFSDKANVVGNTMQTGFNSVRRGGGKAIATTANTAANAGKSVAWQAPGVIKKSASGAKNAVSSFVKNPISTVQNIPKSVSNLATKAKESIQTGIKNTVNSGMDNAEFVMTGKIASPRTKEGFIKTQNDIATNEKWTAYSGANNQSKSKDSKDAQSNSTSSSNTTQSSYSNVKYSDSNTPKPVPSDREKSIVAGNRRKQQKLKVI
jgi:hypothetical protein